jgi:hypothetical protein
MKVLILSLAVLGLTACDVRYRYPCQNPDNWNTPQCQKPQCEVSKDCPEYIFKDDITVEYDKVQPKQAGRPAGKGDSK